MSSCVAVPRTTQFATQVFTSRSLSTSFSTSVSTAPPTTITSVSIICLDNNASNSNGVCSSTSSSIAVVTSSGSTSTISVPITITVPVTLTSSNPTDTLFSTSCAATTTPSTTPVSLTSSVTSSLSEVTPPVTFTSTSSFTLSDGAVVTTNLVLTSLLPLTPVYVTTARPVFNSDKGTNSSSKVGPIVGGVVGGVIGILGLVVVIWFLWRRSKRWNDIFDREDDEKEQRRMTLGDEDVQPRPYHYGLVGHSISSTPPSTPPLGAQERSPAHSPSNSLSVLNPSRLHSRSSSAVDGSAVSMSRSGSDLTTTPSGHTRHNLSTASSTATSAIPLLERPVNMARPSTSRSMDGQSSSRAGMNLFGGNNLQSVASTSRPHSAGASLPSGAAPAAIPGAISRDASTPTQMSPVTEKRKIQQSLPHGAASPVLPTPAVPNIPGHGANASRTTPLLTPRSPRRPSSAPKTAEAPIGGSVSDDQRSSRVESQPPAYSLT